jgi:arylsulfatase A-like enzyme
LPPGYKLDGTSLLPILKSETAPTRHKSFHWQLGDQWAVREGDWKLVVNGNDTDRSPLEGDEKVLLSNLAEDVTERRNLAAQHPDMVKRLTQIHQQWLAEMQ